MVDRAGQGTRDGLGEFDIIARYFAPLATSQAALKLRDDAAVLAVPEGQELVISCDTIVEGVHFRSNDPPDTIGHKALAVNLSDLAAKGARPCVYLLALSLPRAPSPDWLERFAAGLRQLQKEAGLTLAGGDTTATPGPLSITVTAIGLVPQGSAVLRHGAQIGDLLYVSGTIGDGYLGLRLLEEPALARSWGLSEDEATFVIDRYRRPAARSSYALLIRNFAQSAIDVSDGLVGDIEKLCGVSGVGARIEAERIPFSPAAAKALAREPALLATLITAGDDYELVAAVPEGGARAFEAEAKSTESPVTAIGTVVAAGEGVSVLDANGQRLALGRTGFSHF